MIWIDIDKITRLKEIKHKNLYFNDDYNLLNLNIIYQKPLSTFYLSLFTLKQQNTFEKQEVS